MQRKGMMVGSGRQGYYNVTGKDPMVHSLSAKGIKQPQNITLWNRSQRSLPKNPTQNKESLTNLQIGQVFDLEKHPRYKVYASEKSFVIGGGKSDFTNLSDATLVQQWRAETHGTPRYYELLQELGRRRDKKSGLEKLSQHQKVLGGKSTPEENKYIATTILQQLGGNRFRAFTGAKDFVIIEDGVQFSLPKAKDGINRVKITYDAGKDLYVMEFGMQRMVKDEYKYFPKGKLTDVYNEDLRQFFTERTGLYTSFGGKIPFSKKGIDVSALPIENAIYVPSTDKQQQPISQDKFDGRIMETEEFLSNLYGGFSRYEEVGGFKDFDKQKIIKEKGARVVSFSSRADAKDNQKAKQLKRWILSKQKAWGQQAIGYEREGDLFYINKRK
jgi:hypothetical protein